MAWALSTCKPWSHGGFRQVQANARQFSTVGVSISPLTGGEAENVAAKSRSRSTKWTPRFSRIDDMLKLLNSSEDVDAALQGWSKPLSAKNIVTILNNVSKWETALKFFDWLKSRDDMYEINRYTYNVVLKALRNGRQLAESEKLVDEMEARGIQPDNHTYSTLISCAKRCNQFDTALQWFEKMKVAGLLPDEVTYNGLIDIYGRAGQLNEAVELYEKLRSAKWKLDAVTYGALANAYARVGDYQGIMQLSQEMKDLGARPNAVILNTLIGALSKAGKVSQARKVFGEMIESGVEPTPVTLSVMIEMYTQVGAYDQAFLMYEKMKAEGWKSDVGVYNSILKACVEGGMTTEAEELLREILKVGCRPNHLTYRMVMNTYASCGNVEKAREMFQKVVELTEKPDTPLYTVLIRACKQAGDMKQISEVFKEMVSSNCSSDDRLCGMLLSCVSCCKDDQDVQSIVRCLETVNPSLHEILVLMLAKDSNKDELWQKVEAFLSEYAETESRKPLCNSLIDICWSSGMKEEAHKMFAAGVAIGAYEGLETSLPSLWRLNLRTLSFTVAEIALESWLRTVKLTVKDGQRLPEDLIIETGAGRARSGQRLNVVVGNILDSLGAPFTVNTDPSGYYYATGEALEEWVKSKGGASADDTQRAPARPLAQI